jgi:hypothetical protein
MIGAEYVYVFILALFIDVPWNVEVIYGRRHETLIANCEIKDMEGSDRCLI